MSSFGIAAECQSHSEVNGTCVSSVRGASGAELALAYSSASAMLPALPASALPDDVRAAQ